MRSCVAVSAFAALSIAANQLLRTIVAHESLVVPSEVRLSALFLALRRVSFEMGTQMAHQPGVVIQCPQLPTELWIICSKLTTR
jgi:hypothetical protein